MLPLVHNTIRNRSNTMPSSSTTIRSNNSQQSTTTSNDASTSYTTNNTQQQYGVQHSKENSSDCKKLKSGKVCMTTNNGRPFLKKRSITFSSLFSPKSSRSASTNSLNQSSLVEETIASVLKSVPISELLNESNKTVSEQNLNQHSTNYFNYSQDSNLCKPNSITNENLLLDNLVNNSLSSSSINNNDNNDLNIQSTSLDNQQIPPFAPPSYTPIDRLKLNRRPLLLRSQSAPSHHNRFMNLDQLNSTALTTNSSILENIQEISDSVDTNEVLSELIEEEQEMSFKRDSLINHQFQCKLAHSPQETSLISSFNTRKELYEKISETFKINIDQILYCTLNTHKIDMDRLFENHIDLKDTIYVHLKGQTKEIEIEKTDQLLGLTICDNSNGLCLIKKIKDNSIIQKIKFINVGDIIEKINNINLIGYRHIDVSSMLKTIPVGEIFVIRLIEPKSRETDELNHLNLGKQLKNKIKKGYSTLRIRSIGPPVFEEDQINDNMRECFDKINSIIEEFLGISDSELVQQIMDIGKECTNIQQFKLAINESSLKVFNFGDDIWQEIWNHISLPTSQ